MRQGVLLALAVAGILAAALAPHFRRALQAREIRAEQARHERSIAAKTKEVECLRRLAATGLPEGIDVRAELARCRTFRLAGER